MYDIFIAPFAEYGFLKRALIGCIVLSIGASPVGVFLLLRRMSLTGDAIAHAILPGAAIGYLVMGLSLAAMTLGGLIAGILVALASGFISRRTILEEESALAAFYLLSLSLGVILISLRDNTPDLHQILFGSVLGIDNASLIFMGTISTITLLTIAILFRPLIFECIDPDFLKQVSKLSAPTHYIFLCLTVLNLIAGFHAIGTLMAVGIMILPAASARLWVQNIGSLIGLASLISIISCYFGLVLSYQFNLPSGASIIVFAGIIYLVSLIIGKHEGLIINLIKRGHYET